MWRVVGPNTASYNIISELEKPSEKMFETIRDFEKINQPVLETIPVNLLTEKQKYILEKAKREKELSRQLRIRNENRRRKRQEIYLSRCILYLRKKIRCMQRKEEARRAKAAKLMDAVKSVDTADKSESKRSLKIRKMEKQMKRYVRCKDRLIAKKNLKGKQNNELKEDQTTVSKKIKKTNGGGSKNKLRKKKLKTTKSKKIKKGANTNKNMRAKNATNMKGTDQEIDNQTVLKRNATNKKVHKVKTKGGIIRGRSKIRLHGGMEKSMQITETSFEAWVLKHPSKLALNLIERMRKELKEFGTMQLEALEKREIEVQQLCRIENIKSSQTVQNVRNPVAKKRRIYAEKAYWDTMLKILQDQIEMQKSQEKATINKKSQDKNVKWKDEKESYEVTTTKKYIEGKDKLNKTKQKADQKSVSTSCSDWLHYYERKTAKQPYTLQVNEYCESEQQKEIPIMEPQPMKIEKIECKNIFLIGDNRISQELNMRKAKRLEVERAMNLETKRLQIAAAKVLKSERQRVLEMSKLGF